MNFLAPQFFYGLIAIGIPVIIHLFNFRKTKRVYFSSNKFLKVVQEKTSTRRNIKHLLILFCRILFITFLVLTFTQPIIPASEQSLKNRVQIYLDNSFSMSNDADIELSGFDLSIQYVEDIVQQYPKTAEFRLLTNDFASFSNRYRSGKEILEILTELRLSRFTRTSEEVWSRLSEESFLPEQSDVYWISDMQRTVLQTISIDTSRNLRLVPISFPSEKNIFIDTLYLKNQFNEANERREMVLKMVNTGNEDVDNVVLTIYLNDIQSATASLSLPAKGSGETSFSLTSQANETSAGKISFEDFPVTFDNDFYFTLSPDPVISILQIQGENASGYFSKVFGYSKIFEFSSAPSTNVSFDRLDAANLVVLDGLNSISPSLLSALRRKLEEKGSILVVPGVKPEILDYNNLVGGLNIQAKDTASMFEMQLIDYDNPFYSQVFEDRISEMDMPEAKTSIRWFNDRNALLSLKNGDSYLSSFDRGGKVYLMASPLESSYTNLPQHALFVPIMYKIALNSLSSRESLYRKLDQRQIEIKTDSVGKESLLVLEKGDKEIIPAQRTVGNSYFIDLPSNELEAGFYNWEVEGGSSGMIAFNYEKDESRFNFVDSEELSNYFLGTEVEIIDEVADYKLGNVLMEKYRLTELWKWALLLSLLFLGAEMLIFSYMK